MPDTTLPPPAPAPELPDWETIKSDDDFISLPAADQASVLGDWSAHVGGLLKAGGASEDQLGDFNSYVEAAQSEIGHSSDTRRAVRDLNAAGAFGGELSPEQQRGLSAPMMGSEILASMGIPDVWGALQDRNKAKDDFEGMRNQLISTVGDTKLGDLIIARDQKRAQLQQELDTTTAERDRLFDAVDKATDPEERTALQKEISTLEKKADGLAIDLGHRKVAGEAAGTVAEMDKVVRDRQEALRTADNGIDAKTSAASTFFGEWAKTSTAFLKDSKVGKYGLIKPTEWLLQAAGAGPNSLQDPLANQKKMLDEMLEGRVPEGMSRAFVNPSLHDTPVEQLARGTGHLMDWKTPLIFAGTPGFIAFGLGAADQSYGDAAAQTVAAGGTKSEANANGWTAAAWTVPTLVAYMGMGKAAQALTGELLPLSATPLTRAAVTFPVNVAANMTASGALRAMQGEDFMPKNWIEHAVPDALFALHSATDGYKSADKIQKLTPTMEAVAAGTHPDIMLRRMVADSPAFPEEARTVAQSEIAAQQLAARQFLSNIGRPAPKQQPLGESEEATQAQQKMLELAVERKQIMQRLNTPDEAPQPGDVARLGELQGEMKTLVEGALKRGGDPAAAPVAPPAEVLPPGSAVPDKSAVPAKSAVPNQKPIESTPSPERPTPPPNRATVEATPLPESFEPLRSRLSSQLDDALADLEWAHNTGDQAEIDSAETGLQFARSEWEAAMGQPGRGNVADAVRSKVASGEYEWTDNGLAKKAPPSAEAPAAPAVAASPATPPEAAKPAPAPAEAQGATTKPKIRRGFSIPFAPLGTPDMIDFIVEQGGIKLPKKADRKQEHDDAPHLTGVYRRLATQYGKISADEMAQMLADHFFIPEAHVPTMWAEVKKSVDSRMRIREQEAARDRNEKAAIKEGAKQEKAFAADASKADAGEKAIHVENLAIGDTVEVEGEKLRVTDVTADGDVTLEDGKKYGIQVVRDGQVIFGEYTAGEHSGEDHFALESTTDEQLKAEAAKQAQRNQIKEGAARRLQGSAGDTTADIFGEGKTPLFNQRRDQPASEPAPTAQAPAAELPAGLSADQHLKIEATVRATADGFTFRNDAEKDSAIAAALTKVEERAARWIKETGSLDGFSASTLARSRFTDAVRRVEQQRTVGEQPAGGGEEGWTQASRDISDEGAQDPSRAAHTKEVVGIVTAFDKYSKKGGSPEDKAAVIKIATRLALELGVNPSETEIARELGWMTGSGDRERPDATRVQRLLAAASADILRETNLKRNEVLGILPPGLSEVLAEITSAVSFGSALWAEFRSPGEWTDWRSRLLRWSQRQQTSWQEIDNMITEARRVSKSEERRAAITNWIEANGDVALLRTWEQGSKNGRLRDGYRLAQNLTPAEIAYARKVSATYNALFLRGVSEGLLDPASKRPNYVNHVWKLDNAFSRLIGSSSRRLSEYFRNARARTFDTHFEGEKEGYKPKTKDVARLLASYVADMNNAIISRHFVRELTTGLAKDGRPLVLPEGRIDVVEGNNGERVYFVYPQSKSKEAKDYKPPTNPHPAMMKWLWHAKDESGNPILVRDGFILHPEIQDRFNRIFGNNGTNDWLQATGQSAVTKAAKGGLRAIRDVQNATKQTMLGFLSPFHAVQEGTHAIGHRVNPFFNLPKIDLTTSRSQRDAAAHGVMLQPDRVSENQFQEGLGTGSGNLVVNLLRGLRRTLGDNAVGRAPEMLADVADNFQHWLFHQYIPSLKFKTYEHMLERNRGRYKAEIAADPTFDSVVKYLSATQSNAAYGHLNYADLGRHPAFQTLLSMTLLAPDFLEARAKFVGQALKGLTGRNGREQLQAIAFLGLMQWTMARILNKLGDDDWHFESPFEIIHGTRRYRMRSVPEDIFSALHDTRRFIYGRISPIIGKGVLQGLTGVNYRGEQVDFSDTMKELAASAIPLTMQPFTRHLTKTGRDNPVSPWEQMAGSLGIHVARYSPLPAVYKLAADWKQKQTGEDAKHTVYPESKYSKLRYALEDGDDERAAREWDALLAASAGRPPYKVAEGFRTSMTKPLTGSKATDAKFRESLKGKDREQYQRAIDRRQQIMHSFRSMHEAWIKDREKQKAAAPTAGSGGS